MTRPPKPPLDRNDLGANFNAALAYLREHYAYLPSATARGAAVPLDDPGKAVSIATLRDEWLAYRMHEISVATGKPLVKWAHPIDAWAALAERAYGVQCRPDKPTPWFEDRDRPYLNSWQAPAHPGSGGTARPFEDFLGGLIPDSRSHDWYLDRIAHKLRHPEVPGVAVLMTGPQGAGRSSLHRILARLIGEQHTTTPSFESIIKGQFNAFLAKLWVFVPETSMHDDNKISARRSAMEKLKYVMDTSPRPVTIDNKYGLIVDTMSFATYDLATNHNDVMSEHSRRVTVIATGAERPRSVYEKIQSWMSEPRNIGAAYRWLGRRDLSGFTPYHPIETDAARRMIGTARTEIEDAIDKAIADMPAMPAQVSQVMRLADHHLRQEGHVGLVGTYTTVASHLIRGAMTLVLGPKPKVFARTWEDAHKWRDADPAIIKAQLKRNDEHLKAVGALFRLDLVVNNLPASDEE